MMTRNEDHRFRIGGQVVPPGACHRLEIPVAALLNQAMISLVVIVINGARPGPRLWVSGAVHGDELDGPFIIHHLLRKVDPKRLAGTLVLVPAVNVFGVLQQSRYLPDRRDLNRSFPGTSRGSLAARLAHLFMKEVVDRCTHGIDLHSAAIHRTNLPQIRANLQDAETLRCARAFGAPVIIHSNVRDGSLRQAATRRGIPTLLYEAGEALRHDPVAVRVGVAGVQRVMGALGMYSSPPPAPRRPLESFQTHWLRAAHTGYMVLDVDLGERVKTGERLGRLHLRYEVVAGASHHEIRAPVDGIVIGRTQNPLVYLGDAIVHVAVLG